MDTPRGKHECEEGSEMNFAAFSAAGSAGTHFMSTSGQALGKIQQNGTLSQVVGTLADGTNVQYLRTLDGGATLQATPQLISLPITLPGSKPGDPQQTVQIQVLNPSLMQPQPAKYQMQIPIQGFQQGNAVLTVAYSPENNDGSGIQILGNGLPEGLQVVSSLPPEMQLIQPAHAHSHDKDQQNIPQESSQGTETNENGPWVLTNGQQEQLAKYLNQLPPQQAQNLPISLQQFLRLNPSDQKKHPVTMEATEPMQEGKMETVAEAILGEDGTLRIHTKKKKKYKKKPPKPSRPKPGQVVIATSPDGSMIFCCPECDMAYPDKEHLENHLVVHKIERRFICGICGAGLKRKEHLERHKLGHNPERPYVCSVCRKGFKRREHLNLHTVIHSGVKTEMCIHCGKGFYRKDHLRKHTRSHEAKNVKDSALAQSKQAEGVPVKQEQDGNGSGNVLPEITIHVPNNINLESPLQINIPPHMMQQAQNIQLVTQQAVNDVQSQLDALLAQHS